MIGNRIRSRRNQLGMSQEQLAEQIGKDQNQVYRFEKGFSEPKAEDIIKLCFALDVSSSWLLGITEMMTPFEGISLLEEDEKVLVKLYRLSNKRNQQLILQIAETASNSK